MHRMLHIEPSLCTGCLQCEMACSFEHEGEFNPARSRIRVFEFEHGRTSVPYTCTQCVEAWCMKACPTAAISVDIQLGAKLVRREGFLGQLHPGMARVRLRIFNVQARLGSNAGRYAQARDAPRPNYESTCPFTCG